MLQIDRFASGAGAVALTSQNIATATTLYGEWLDTAGYRSIVASISATVTTGEISSVTWQESSLAGHSDAADIDDANNLYQPDDFPVTATGVIRVGTVAKKRYVRLKIVTTGTVDIDVFGMAELNDSYDVPNTVSSSVLTEADINSPGPEGDSIVTHPKRPV